MNSLWPVCSRGPISVWLYVAIGDWTVTDVHSGDLDLPAKVALCHVACHVEAVEVDHM